MHFSLVFTDLLLIWVTFFCRVPLLLAPWFQGKTKGELHFGGYDVVRAAPIYDLPLYMGGSVWEALSVVSQKWTPFPTACCSQSALCPTSPLETFRSRVTSFGLWAFPGTQQVWACPLVGTQLPPIEKTQKTRPWERFTLKTTNLINHPKPPP